MLCCAAVSHTRTGSTSCGRGWCGLPRSSCKRLPPSRGRLSWYNYPVITNMLQTSQTSSAVNGSGGLCQNSLQKRKKMKSLHRTRAGRGGCVTSGSWPKRAGEKLIRVQRLKVNRSLTGRWFRLVSPRWPENTNSSITKYLLFWRNTEYQQNKNFCLKTCWCCWQMYRCVHITWPI